MGAKSRRKGAEGERQAAKAIAEHWHATGAERGARNGVDAGEDVMGALPGSRVEVKRYAKIAALRFMDQATADAPEGCFPVVVMREDRGGWVTMIRMEDSVRFAEAVLANRAKASNN